MPEKKENPLTRPLADDPVAIQAALDSLPKEQKIITTYSDPSKKYVITPQETWAVANPAKEICSKACELQPVDISGTGQYLNYEKSEIPLEINYQEN